MYVRANPDLDKAAIAKVFAAMVDAGEDRVDD